MKKQVILEPEEYNKLISIAALATQILDKFCYIENNKLKGSTHIVDTDKCPKMYEELYLLLLWADEFQEDIVEKLPKDYFETEVGTDSVLQEIGSDF